MRKFFWGFFFVILSLSGCKKNITPMKLWYTQPAKADVPDSPNAWTDDPEWLKAFPLGNGALGVMIFGDVALERIQLNEKSLWSGSPDDNDNPDAKASLPKIRELLFAGKFNEASVLTLKTQICKGYGSGYGNGTNVPFGSYQTLGDLWIESDPKTEYTDYRRELNIMTGIARVSYRQNNIRFRREAFVSYPDKVLVYKISADRKNAVNLSFWFTRPERYAVAIKNGQIILHGALSDGKGGEGMKYFAIIRPVIKGGRLEESGNKIQVHNANEVVLLVSAATDYRLHYPDYKREDFENEVWNRLEKASQLDYKQLYRNHLADFRNLSERCILQLGNSKVIDTVPTDIRLKRYQQGQEDLYLESLYFQYGRYLLISSSRPGSLPANLQGIWASKIQTPWNGDYHTNINVQMNYWPANVTGLHECNQPLMELISSLMEPGSRTAAVQYGARGWCVHPITNVWGFTSPGENPLWGLHLGAGGWLCRHIWEHYQFTQDTGFLRTYYPVMKNAALFYCDWLVKDPRTGKWVSGPAGSPENSFTASDGKNYQISMGPSHDQEVIYDLFSSFLVASKILGMKDSVTRQIETILPELLLPGIGSDGRLMEWAEEFAEPEPGHRHMSHLYALHPGNQYTFDSSPEFMEAARKSLDYRLEHGGGHTGWSAAWIISFRARLHDGDKAHDMLKTLLKRSTCPNLFDLCPPFQIDGNFGATAGIAEMLIQSHEGFIRLLPALPSAWPDGKVSGLCARGGFVVDLEWKNQQLLKAVIHAEKGSQVKIRYKDYIWDLKLSPGSSRTITL
jgi:alpha-L-fucosidase 2